MMQKTPDLVILNFLMPGINGVEVMRRLRQKTDIPIILQSAASREMIEQRIPGGLDGVDEFINVPFSQALMLDRVKRLLRRRQVRQRKAERFGDEQAITCGQLTIDPLQSSCRWRGAEVRLEITEFLILDALARRPGFVKSRDSLMDAAFDDGMFVDDRTIDMHVKNIRRRFRAVDPEFDAIETLYGVGYRFKEEAEAA